MKQRIERAKWLPIFVLAIVLMLIYGAIGNLSSITAQISRFLWVISPIFYGILFSYFLLIPHRFIEKLFSKIKIGKKGFFQKNARLFSTLVVFVLVVLILAFVFSIILPILFASVIDLANSIPAYVNFIIDFIDDVPADSVWHTLNIVDTVTEYAGNMLIQVFNSSMIEQFAMGFISFANEIFSVILGLVVSLYMLLERDRIIGFFKSLGNALFKRERSRDRINKYMQQVNKVLFTFIASKGLDSIINFVVVTSILFIFNVPYALLLGIIAGIFNFIPYLGSLIAVILISGITLLTGGFGKAIQVLIPLLVFQQIDGNFIEPRIMKSSLKISPILVIIAVVAGGAYFGIIGMFLAVPIAVIIKQILLEYISYTESIEKDRWHGVMGDIDEDDG